MGCLARVTRSFTATHCMLQIVAEYQHSQRGWHQAYSKWRCMALDQCTSVGGLVLLLLPAVADGNMCGVFLQLASSWAATLGGIAGYMCSYTKFVQLVIPIRLEVQGKLIRCKQKHWKKYSWDEWLNVLAHASMPPKLRREKATRLIAKDRDGCTEPANWAAAHILQPGERPWVRGAVEVRCWS